MLRKYIKFYDAAATDGAGGTSEGAILKGIQDFAAKAKEQNEAVKTQILISIDEKHNAISGELKVVKDEQEKLKERVKEMSAKSRTAGMFGASEKSFGDMLGEALEQKHEADKDAFRAKRPFALKLDTKAVGDVQASNFTTNVTSSFVQPQARPGIIMNPTEPIRLRQLLPIGATSSNKITYMRENGGEGAPGMVAPGGTKPQMDFDLTVEEADVRKIAGHIRVHEEVLDDIPYLQSYLTRKGTEKVLDLEDSQILYGDGTGQNLEGLFTVATAFAAGTGAVVATPNRFDVLRAAALQARRANRSLSVHLVSPLDYFLITSLKGTEYTFLGGGNGTPLNIDGVPILAHSKITEGDFLSLDTRAAEIAFRKGIEVRFFEQDRDNAIVNMVTIVIEERLALPIYEPGGIIKGTFTTAITDLTS